MPDVLRRSPNFVPPPRWGGVTWRALIIVGLVAAVLATSATAYQLAAPRDDFLARSLRQVPVVREFAQILRPDLADDGRERYNVLIAGIGGEGHDGPLLTDTLVVAVLEPKHSRFGLVSIPRDLAVATAAGAFRKVNSVYALAEDRRSGSGLAELSRTVSAIIGAPIDRTVVVDFDAFRELIDALGGVTVNVERSFTDYSFPTDSNGRVSTVSFEAGLQRLDGSRALQFVRSRHGTNGESSDFARARRQQLLITATVAEALQLRTLTSPRRLQALISLAHEHVRTDLGVGEAVELALRFKDVDPSAAPKLVLDSSPPGFLTDAIGPDGSYLLVPRGNTFARIHEAVATLFEGGAGIGTVSVEVSNGTAVGGLARRAADYLVSRGFSVERFGNAHRNDVERTVVYDQSNGTKRAALELLRELFGDPLTVQGEPPTGTSTADFVVLIGADDADRVAAW